LYSHSMDFNEFTGLVAQVDIGKQLPTAVYVHRSALRILPANLLEVIERVAVALNIPAQKWNILKLSKRDFRVSLLSYPTFESEPYPQLAHSWTIDLTKLSLREADYSKSENPPILHRREAFLSKDHPQRSYFNEFTREGEAAGLYENTRIIGTKNGWERVFRRKGLYLAEDGHFQPLTEITRPDITNVFTGTIDRHKTALSRDKLSVPLFLMAERGYLNGKYTVLDYGCGKGDDIRELQKHEIECNGWDPVHQPDTDIENSDIVNLGYVINVIEDREERNETLKRAYSHTEKILIVSAMLGNESIFERFKPYKDGVITSRNTFQKYYMQGELRHYVENTLDTNAIALAPGIFAVFKDKAEEQWYLAERHRTRHQWRQLTTKAPKPITKKQVKSILEKYKELLEDFWYTCLDLGRLPANDEFEQAENLKHACSSFNKAFTICEQYFDQELFEQAKKERHNDLLVYFALSFFNKKREIFSRMPEALKRDIKAFFGKYSIGRELGKELLFSVSDVDVIYKSCITAHSTLPASELNGQHDLVFHKDYLNMCPVELRIYVGCATQLYGDLDSISLIKAHIVSGKVSLMGYDDWNKDIPLLFERIKIKMREQEIDFFDYVGDYEPQPLTNKSSYVDDNRQAIGKPKSECEVT
jgi:DNA phosphorothioation-associated putative methyltransferase